MQRLSKQRLSMQRLSIRRRRSFALFAILCALTGGARAVALIRNTYEDNAHRFAIIGHGFTDGGEKRLSQALRDNDDNVVAFLVVTGVKGVNEPCTDKLYQQRRELLDDARRPVVVLPAGSDWSECKNSAGRSDAIERLWEISEPVLENPPPAIPYWRGSWGPREIDELIAPRRWHLPSDHV